MKCYKKVCQTVAVMVYLMRALLANLQRQYLHFVGIRFLFLFNVSLSFCDRLLLLRYQIKSQQQLSLKSYLEITFFYRVIKEVIKGESINANTFWGCALVSPQINIISTKMSHQNVTSSISILLNFCALFFYLFTFLVWLFICPKSIRENPTFDRMISYIYIILL